MIDLTEKTLATERKYTGRIVSVDLLEIKMPSGGCTTLSVWFFWKLKGGC